MVELGEYVERSVTPTEAFLMQPVERVDLASVGREEAQRYILSLSIRMQHGQEIPDEVLKQAMEYMRANRMSASESQKKAGSKTGRGSVVKAGRAPVDISALQELL